MQNGVHFISGMPRSGSTLLAALLLQNPRFHAGMTSPVGGLVTSLLGQMSGSAEHAVFLNEAKRRAILKGVFDSYYADVHPHKLVFDTHRVWCSKMPALADLYPDAKVIACVRHAPWVIDSIERLVRTNKFEPSGIFNYDPTGTVYSRSEGLSAGAGMVGYAWNALREAFYGEHSDRLMLLTYETLTDKPEEAMTAVYDFVGEPAFTHDFENVEYSADEFDARLGTPGLPRVGRRVEHAERRTVLPPDLFRRYENDSFWRDPKLNPRGVRIV